MAILFTFLGIPRKEQYDTVRYYLSQAPVESEKPGPPRAIETCYVAQAIAEIFPGVRKLVVFATDKAWERHEKAFPKALAPLGVEYERQHIPNGKSEDELDEMFRIFIERLEKARSPAGRETAGTVSSDRMADDSILIDITHGFRTQGFLAGAAISLMRAVRADWPQIRILYGAYEARDESVSPPRAPIWDITAFLDMIDWAQALRLFLKTGRAEEAAARASALGRTLRRNWAQGGRGGREPNLDRFADSLKAFSRSFSTVRTGDLLLQSADGKRPSLAEELLKRAEESQAEIRHHLPPLATIIDELIAMLQPLSGSPAHLAGSEHADLVAELAALYQRFERPLQAVATLREGYINLACPPDAACPGRKDFNESARRMAKDMARALFPAFKNKVGDLRNDLLHGGYRENAIRADRISSRIGEMIATFKKDSRDPRLRDLQRNDPPSATVTHNSPGGIFINLSNHPSKDWAEPQRRAAEALGHPIHDIPFPDVPAGADEDGIDRMAGELSDTILAMKPAAVLVQGEFTLAFAVVCRLEAAGIPCYAAATPRLAEKRPDEDDATLRRFRFARLRRYRVRT